ncbi:hypothetical protein [Clostridium guangxiense]|uniref:hypothetical protein n=2 Tax=Clostridium TaxID=1485 RepID=UPI001E5E0699|nr:hypothetical protein [Clostridium guangxiense]MCD2347533.1 hypothetical protein [Clostridium guangxiense]
MAKKLKIIFISLILMITLISICINNIQLNRNIYCNDLHIKKSKQDMINKINDYNLDDMEKHLDNLESKDQNSKEKNSISDVIEKVYVPKFRILFRTNPLDIRLETENYKFYINNEIVVAFGNRFANINNTCSRYIDGINSRFNEIEKEVYAFGINFNENVQNGLENLKSEMNKL